MSERKSDGENVKNDRKTKPWLFGPGNSGRPKGARNKRSLLVEAILSEDIEAIARAVSRAAFQGDVQACRVILDRLCPPRTGRPVQFPTPSTDLGVAGSITATFRHVLQATAT